MTLLFKSTDCYYYKIEDEILFMQFQAQEINEFNILPIIEKRKELAAKHNLTHVIADHSNSLKMLPKARRISYASESFENINSLALIGDNPISIFGFNVFIKVRPVDIPMKGFTKLEPAVMWSLKQKEILDLVY